ncbi:DNA/RNA non-specific endonuclease [Lactococcus garvieae]|uniref:DNA/RNA non-specific endonuclease n=1 Tax=Lactococcus garvieae TaxID=1363 RepID=UPI0018D784D9|nr:DNA/RNA non-specific endonuclease [Lactococcus garvieae]QPS71508.1 DNA/RNA non-specific endonuclease [Lactococcus garvieae]
MPKKKQTRIKASAGILGTIVVLGLGILKANPEILSTVTGSYSQNTPAQSQQLKSFSKVDFGSIKDKVPTQSLAQSVLTPSIKKNLKESITYNGTGAFIVNDNKTDLNAKVNSAPYVQLAQQDSLGRPRVANALLNKSSRQYKNRSETTGSNGKSNSAKINPVGWQQLMIPEGSYSTLYNRGHSIGYALAGNIKGFDASEANPQNISTQTAWANQSSNGNDENTGQNYYEGLVRKALDKNKTVRYRVEPLYEDDDLVPSGTHMEAKSKDGSLEFNVFIPNVQPGIQINYATGKGTMMQ